MIPAWIARKAPVVARGFYRDAADFAELAKTKLTMPVLSIGGDKSLGAALGAQAKLIAPDVTVIVLKDAGHWILEERREETIAALVRFLQQLPPALQ